MATGGLYGNASESVGLYGNTTNFGGSYFEWFIFYQSDTQPATPTGGSWSFTTNSGTAPTGWSVVPFPAPTLPVWVSIALVNSRSDLPLVWSAPGLFSYSSGLPILSGSGTPSVGDGINSQLYIQTSTTPQTIWFKQSGTWNRLVGSTLYADLTSAQTVAGIKTFSSPIVGSVTGTSANVTGIVDIANGGTSSTTASGARSALGLGTSAVLNAGVANGVATLDAGGTVPLSQIPASIQGGVSYQGTWNASTNTPTLTSSVGTKGYYYVVSTAGSTNLNGITSWNIGDWAIYNGTAWEKIDNTDAVTSVNGYTGTVVLTQPDIAGTASLTTVQTLTNKTLTSPIINEILDANGNEILGLSPTASATDFVTVKNGIGVAVPLHVYADGPSANIGLHLQPKGTGLITISDGIDFNKGIRFRSSGSAASAITLLDAVSTAGHVITLPDATTTLVGRNTTDTLTNKTINLTSNTLVATSAQLASAVTDETGSGSLVFATSPSLVTPLLGTPTSGNFSTGTFTWPTFNQNTTGTAAGLSSTLAIASGGTGATTAGGALTSLGAYPASNPNGYTSNTGTVTSVSGTGVVNGLTLTGTVTTSGSLTLGGTLSLVSPPPIGSTTPSTGNFTTLTENSVAVVTQSDIGTAPNEIPLNQYLGSLAYQNGDAYYNTGMTVGYRNRVINGNMVISQRGVGPVTVTSETYLLDRWNASGQSGPTCTVEQTSTAPENFVNSLKYTVVTGSALSSTTYSDVRQYIEGFNTADLGWGTTTAKPVTISFWVRCSVTGTFAVSCVNNSYDRCYPASYTINSANTWEYKTVTIAGDVGGAWQTTNFTGIRLVFDLGIGSTYSSTINQWSSGTYFGGTGVTKLAATTGATWFVTGVQLEKGNIATSFDVRPYGTELALCQRYFQTLPFSSGYFAMGSAANTSTVRGTLLKLSVTMRTSPTVTIPSAGSGSGQMYFNSPSGGVPVTIGTNYVQRAQVDSFQIEGDAYTASYTEAQAVCLSAGTGGITITASSEL